MTGTNRRTLKDISYYPSPDEIYKTLMLSDGWPYKTNRQFYLMRDRSLVALLYLLALRISEVLRLRKNQFKLLDNLDDRIEVRGIKLSKSRIKGKPRKEQFRQVNYLPLIGDRSMLSDIIIDYLNVIEEDEKLFKFGNVRAWQIVTTLTDNTCHWFRAFGEEYLYDKWGKDLLAVADYVKVDPRTLQEYIRRRYEKYKPV